MSSQTSERYSQRGVSASKEDVHKAIENIEKGLFPKAFCKIVPDYLTNDEEYCLVMHADGAGTKSSLAYIYWKETGDFSVWKGIAQDALIMNIDDLICVGATDNIMLSSTIGRNKNLIPGEVISAIINGTEALISDLAEHGITIRSTGGETADVGDLVRTIIVDSTVTARLKRTDVIDNANIELVTLSLVWPPLGRPLMKRNTMVGWAATDSHRPGTMFFRSIWPIPIPKAMMHPFPKNWCIPEKQNLRMRLKDRPWMPGSWFLPHPYLCAHSKENPGKIYGQRYSRYGALQRGSANQDSTFYREASCDQG